MERVMKSIKKGIRHVARRAEPRYKPMKMYPIMLK
jgi:hypothetical protein